MRGTKTPPRHSMVELFNIQITHHAFINKDTFLGLFCILALLNDGFHILTEHNDALTLWSLQMVFSNSTKRAIS